jgi:hypothetical protein
MSRLEALEHKVEVPSLETLFTSEDYFGVTTATDLQRAICRIADGEPLEKLAHAAHLAEAMGNWLDAGQSWDGRPIPKPRELVLLAGTRSGKTRLSVAQAVRLAQTCSVRGMKPGEVPRVPIVSLTLDLANEAFRQLAGTCIERPKLRRLLLEEPTAGRVLLRHPSGRPVEITVSAGKRAGSSLVARWLAGVIFDEAPRMYGGEDGHVVHLDDSLAAIQSRLLPGSQVLEIGSPWAPLGPVYRKVVEAHGRPTERLVVVRAQGHWLNPMWWTPERIASLRASTKAEDQLSYRVDCLADFTDPESGLIASAELNAVTRIGELVKPSRRPDGVAYAAAIDPAARMNAWTLVVKHRERGVDVVDFVRQWHRPPGGEALDPDKVLGEIADALRPYGVTLIATDKWQVDTLKALARRHALQLIEYDYAGQEVTELYLDMASKIAQKLVELPPDPELRADLLSARRRVTQQGMVIDLPVSGTGRHSDYVPALARVLRMHVADCRPELPKVIDIETRLLAAARKKFTPPKPKRGRGHWWQRGAGP